MQEKVKVFNSNKNVHKKPMPLESRLLDIQSELGEMAKEYLKNSKYGTEKFNLTEDFILEYGDVLYCLLSLANELDINASDTLDKVLQKYQMRIDKNNSMGNN